MSQTIELTWEDRDSNEYRISARVGKSYPGNWMGKPDNWCPAEGGECEDLTAKDQNGTSLSWQDMEARLGWQQFEDLLQYVEERAAFWQDSRFDEDRDDPNY